LKDGSETVGKEVKRIGTCSWERNFGILISICLEWGDRVDDELLRGIEEMESEVDELLRLRELESVGRWERGERERVLIELRSKLRFEILLELESESVGKVSKVDLIVERKEEEGSDWEGKWRKSREGVDSFENLIDSGEKTSWRRR